jgi:hypothetical protein
MARWLFDKHFSDMDTSSLDDKDLINYGNGEE